MFKAKESESTVRIDTFVISVDLKTLPCRNEEILYYYVEYMIILTLNTIREITGNGMCVILKN